ncbi:MAG: hypothetical protein LBB80_10055 [Treponema sp.]|jgi:hypothetical protein|nr:hypothetical protein [Treponema sp.]
MWTGRFVPSSICIFGRRRGIERQTPIIGGQILGAIIAIGALVLKATISPALDIDAAIKVAAFVVLIFAPIDLSMIFKNIFEPLGTRKEYPEYYGCGTGKLL